MKTAPSFSPYTVVPVRIVVELLEELEERAARIRLSVGEIARRAGVRHSVVSQWKSGYPVCGATFGRHLRKMQQAVVDEEAALRRYLSRAKGKPRELSRKTVSARGGSASAAVSAVTGSRWPPSSSRP